MLSSFSSPTERHRWPPFLVVRAAGNPLPSEIVTVQGEPEGLGGDTVNCGARGPSAVVVRQP
jgi:hypothetical protein